jgi:hypothetical protein
VALGAEDGQVGEEAAAAPQGHGLAERLGQGRFGHVGAAEGQVAGAAFFCEAGAVEAEPATGARGAVEAGYCLGGVEGTLAGLQVTTSGIGLGPDDSDPVPGG